MFIFICIKWYSSLFYVIHHDNFTAGTCDSIYFPKIWEFPSVYSYFLNVQYKPCINDQVSGNEKNHQEQHWIILFFVKSGVLQGCKMQN